jgi:superfamily I DNA/RNA helicase
MLYLLFLMETHHQVSTDSHQNIYFLTIGIDGSVQETCIADCQFGIKNRTAIICKDKKQTQHFLLPIISSEKINNVSQTGELLEGQFNLISIQECKGLEFDTVYVIDFDMFENEKYVAYTRALGQLIVLKDNLAELLNRENEEKRRKEEERKKKVAEERKHIESQASKAKEKEKCIGDLIAVLTQILEKQIKTAKEKHECVEALAGALTQILDKRMREEAEKQKKEIRRNCTRPTGSIAELPNDDQRPDRLAYCQRFFVG